MSKEVRTIGLADIQPVEEVVTKLKELLEQAESGEIQGIGFVHINSEGTIGYGWNFDQDRFRLCGGLDYLKFAIQQDIYESNE